MSSPIADNWRRVRAAVDAAAQRAGRDPASVRVVIASKTKPVEAIRQAIAAGASDFGENYVQEAASKIPAFAGTPLRWHLIGHLQRNKAARAVELFDTIQTIDNEALGLAVARHAERLQRVVSVLVEVNLAAESSKTGVTPERLGPLIAVLAQQRWLRLEGLMAIPPVTENAEQSRPYFRRLRQLRDQLATATALPELSMGMSDDYQVAVEEGATIVRIGRAVLGKR